MQTFLPYSDFRASARALDRARLGKQRVEALQLLQALQRGYGGWTSHPAAKMWKGHESSLTEYGLTICEEWIARGYKDTCYDKISEVFKSSFIQSSPPEWLGYPAFHLSHQSNLIRKMPEHYGKLWPEVPNDLPYVWPRI